MLGNEIFELTMSMIDEMLDNGSLDTDAVANYKAKSPYILNMLQHEVYDLADFSKTFKVSRKPISPIKYEKNELEHNNEDIIIEANNATSYYFEINGEGTVFLERYESDWVLVDTLTISNTNDAYKSYKGYLTGSIVRLRFGGSYYYNIRNVAFFDKNFSSVDKIPNFEKYVGYDLPSDFKKVEEVLMEDTNEIIDGGNYFIEQNKFYVRYELNANIKIVYTPIPTKYTSLTQALEVDTITATTILPNGLAAHLLLNENQSLASYFNQRYEELKVSMKKPIKSNIVSIVDKYDSKLSY